MAEIERKYTYVLQNFVGALVVFTTRKGGQRMGIQLVIIQLQLVTFNSPTTTTTCDTWYQTQGPNQGTKGLNLGT